MQEFLNIFWNSHSLTIFFIKDHDLDLYENIDIQRNDNDNDDNKVYDNIDNKDYNNDDNEDYDNDVNEGYENDDHDFHNPAIQNVSEIYNDADNNKKFKNTIAAWAVSYNINHNACALM